MVTRLVLLLLALGIGFAAGVLWAQRQSTEHLLPTPLDNKHRSTFHNGTPSSPQTQVRDGHSVNHQIPTITSLAQAANITSEFAQTAALYQLAAPFDADGLVQLLQEAKRDISTADYSGASSILIGRLAELNFDLALGYALNNSEPAQLAWIGAIFHAQARIDQDVAVAKAQPLKGKLREVAGRAILRANGKLSPSARQSIAATLGLSPSTVAMLQHSPKEAWAATQDITNPLQQSTAQAQVAQRWGQSDPWGALQATQEMQLTNYREQVQAALLTSIAENDLNAALAWIEGQSANGSSLLFSFVDQLANQYPNQAENLLPRLPREIRDHAELTLWTKRAISEPEAAANWLAGQESGGAQNAKSTQLLLMLGMTSPKSAERFMQALPAERQANLEADYIGFLALQDPQGASQRIERIADEGERARASSNLYFNWASSDPVGAGLWIEEQVATATPASSRFLGHLWASQDLESAETFINAMSTGLKRDQLLLSLIQSSAMSSEKFEQTLSKITDPELYKEAEELRSLQDSND